MVAVKDFDWKSEPGRPKAVWRSRQVPLKDGLVAWPEFFKALAALGYDGPVSLHSEYKGTHSWRDLSTDELLAQTAGDLAFVPKVPQALTSLGSGPTRAPAASEPEPKTPERTRRPALTRP